MYLWVIHFYCRVVSHCVYIPPFISHVLTGIWIVSKFLYSSGLLNISDRNIHIRACILAFFTLMWIPRVEDCVIYRYLCKFLRNSQLFSKGYIYFMGSLRSSYFICWHLIQSIFSHLSCFNSWVVGLCFKVCVPGDWTMRISSCALLISVFLGWGVCSDLSLVLVLGGLLFCWEVFGLL